MKTETEMSSSEEECIELATFITRNMWVRNVLHDVRLKRREK